MKLRHGIASGAVIALVAALLHVPTAGYAASPTALVKVNTQRMTDATLKSTQVGWYTAGQRITLVCYKRGQAVQGYYSPYIPGGWDDIWYKVSDGYWVADVDIDTGSNSPVTPACTTAPPAPTSASVDTNAWYTLTPRVSSLKVDVRGGSTANGSWIQQYSANSTASQRFRFVANGDGTYRIVTALSGSKVMDVAGGATTNGAKVQLWTWTSVNQQRWQVLNATTAGFVTLKPKHATSRCLDVPGASTRSGVQLQIYTCNNTTSQQFKLTKVGVVTPTAGACNAFTGATTLGTFNVAGYKLPVCGPRPDWDGTKWAAYSVRPYSGAPTWHPGYQCAELSARWLYHRYGVASISANGAQVVDRYATTYSTKFSKIGNGTANRAPRPGDVISFSSRSTFSDFGHVGVVVNASVSASGNGYIEVAEQNYGGNNGGLHKYTVTAWKVQGQNGLIYIKWLTPK